MTGPRRRPRRSAAIVLGGCLALTAFATAVTAALHRDTEQKLLQRRTNEAGAVLVAAISGVQTPMESAAALAGATDGDPESFVAVLGTQVRSGRFTSAALYDVDALEPVASVGEPPLIADGGEARIRAMFDQATSGGPFVVVDLLDLAGRRRLGYAASAESAEGTTYVAYSEQALPERTLTDPPTGAFSGLGYALYLGSEEREDALLYASEADRPVTGPRADTEVEFGDRGLLLVATPTETLGGRFSLYLPWFVAAVGLVLALGAAVLTARLVRGRAEAEELAADVSRLYGEQRSRSETLQRSLIPRSLEAPPATVVVGRYWPAEPDSEIGGDFYDLFPLGGGRWGITIGDVCGKGIEAAALTGVTRHTIRAAARHLSDPVDVLRWTHEAIAAYSGSTYCTACFGVLTLAAEHDGTRSARLDLALGGHPGPLVRRADGTIEELGKPGTVLGLLDPELVATRHVLGPGDLLLFYTDGITDAPGELAVPLEELRDLVTVLGEAGPDALVDGIRAAVDARRPGGSGDDTAVLVVQLVGPDVESSAPDALDDRTDVAVGGA